MLILTKWSFKYELHSEKRKSEVCRWRYRSNSRIKTITRFILVTLLYRMWPERWRGGERFPRYGAGKRGGYFLQTQIAPNYRSAVYGIDSSGQWKKKKKRKKKEKEKKRQRIRVITFHRRCSVTLWPSFRPNPHVRLVLSLAPWMTSNSSRASEQVD